MREKLEDGVAPVDGRKVSVPRPDERGAHRRYALCLSLAVVVVPLACAGDDSGRDAGMTGSASGLSTSGGLATSLGTSESVTGGGTVATTDGSTSSTTIDAETDTSADSSTSSAESTSGDLTTTSSMDTTSVTSDTESTTSDIDTDTGTTGDPPDPLLVTPNLWYAVENKIHYIELDESDGSVIQLVTSTISTPLLDGYNGLTMLVDGALLGSRVLEGVGTQIYLVEEPPTASTTIEVQILGMLPEQLLVEALYTDCKGLVYLMDSGVNLSTAAGNRLLRFSGNYLVGDFAYEVITDLENASVADIDDLGPGIDAQGEITDGRGFAIDSGTVYDFDYNTGTGVSLGSGGTYGSHALGASLFSDETARLYLLDHKAKLFEADPVTLALSVPLVTGPTPDGDAPPGWSGLAGPLTECTSTLPD